MTRTAPVDLPQPRRPPEGYVEMSFKSRPSLEQDYINMSMGGSSGSIGSAQSSSSRTRNLRVRPNNRNDKSQRSQPIAIQASSKTTKTPSFLPLNGDSPTSESLASTPASPPRATPTGSNATIFPFSLNSPQSPIKPFTSSTPSRDDNEKMYSATSIDADYALMAPGTGASTSSQNSVAPDTTKSLANPMKIGHESGHSPLTKRLADLTITRPRVTRNSTNSSNTSADGIAAKNDDESFPSGNSTNETTTTGTSESMGFRSLNNQPSDTIGQSPASKRRGSEITFSKMKTSRGNFPKDDNASSSTTSSSTSGRIYNDNSVQNSQQELPTSPLTKRLCDLTVAKAKLVQRSPNTSPTPSAGFKIIQGQKSSSSSSSGKMDDGSGSTTPTVTPTATPSPLDSEGYEKLQPGATILHYASLDLPEVGGAPPVSPTPVIEGFNYAEIDFAKLKQN